MEITLCDKVLIGDIPTYEIKTKEEGLKLLNHWLESKNFENSVFVCFNSWRDCDLTGDFRGEQTSILVSHDYDDIFNMAEKYIDDLSLENFNFAVFEFENYQEAFGYCLDLKESF